MKNFAIILVFLVLFRPLFPVLDYVLNYNYIATELCENRENLVMGCNGKCYLVKELAKASDAEKPLSANKKHQPLVDSHDLFFACAAMSEQVFNQISPECDCPEYRNGYTVLTTQSIFHPPSGTA